MTEKLYYKDAYIRDFEAAVVLIGTDARGSYAVLDATAFFPEEGGQSADTGYIGDLRVLDVQETDGTIRHYVDLLPEVGRKYACRINFDDRFEKMQCHTAEHIISGAINRLYGFDNVGFHLGAADVTMDINGYLTREQLDEVEMIANRAVFDNVAVKTYFPTPSELSEISYRSKLDITENVRLVEVDGYDVCACCAPHVRSTGEIGLIKILDFEKHRGGLRINIAAGYRALRDYREKYSNVLKISALYSEPQPTVSRAAEAFAKTLEETRLALKAARLSNARLLAELITPTDSSAVHYYPGLSLEEMRELANVAKEKVSGVVAVLSGEEGNYRYVMTSLRIDLSPIYKKIISDLGGRGGGRDNMIQGSFCADLDTIKNYFSKI